jgi:hypothetical protein
MSVRNAISILAPPAFNENEREHRRQLSDYAKAVAEASVPADGSAPIGMATYDHATFNINANTNNLALGAVSVVRLVLDAARDLTGMVGVDGQRVCLINASAAANTLTLKNESGSSDASNRFKLGGDMTVTQFAAIQLWKDPEDDRWRIAA